MKRWLLRFGLAAVTFIVGYGVYFLTTTFGPYVHPTFGALPYCHVARNAEWYHDREILVNARVFVGKSGIYVYEDCDPVEALAAAVNIDGKQPVIGPGYVDNLLLDDNKPNMQTAQALIRGRFDAHASPGCWAPKFRIYAEKVEFLSGLTDYEPPQTEGPSTRTKH